jgi:hypothetical protein
MKIMNQIVIMNYTMVLIVLIIKDMKIEKIIKINLQVWTSVKD